jgi:hypothetical protein
MTKRADDFIYKNRLSIGQHCLTGGAIVLQLKPSELAELLELFHKECSPVEKLCKTCKFDLDGTLSEPCIICDRILHTHWQPKEEPRRNIDQLKYQQLVYDLAKYFEGCQIVKENPCRTCKYCWNPREEPS